MLEAALQPGCLPEFWVALAPRAISMNEGLEPWPRRDHYHDTPPKTNVSTRPSFWNDVLISLECRRKNLIREVSRVRVAARAARRCEFQACVRVVCVDNTLEQRYTVPGPLIVP